MDYSETVNELISLVNYYNYELSKIFDKHAPEVEKEIAFRKPTPWTSEDIKPDKKIRRRLERTWRQTEL